MYKFGLSENLMHMYLIFQNLCDVGIMSQNKFEVSTYLKDYILT